MSFISKYLQFCKNNEAAELYHLWSCLTSLSTIVGRRVWCDQGYFRIYPNLYVVLVGKAGNRKTTAMAIGRSLVQAVGKVGGHIPVTADSQTKEGLVKDMADSINLSIFKLPDGTDEKMSQMFVCVPELKEFVGPGAMNMVNFLITVWDQDRYEYKTRNKEPLCVENPYLTILACETPEWITSRLQDDIISGGFSRRVVFAYSTTPEKRITFPKVSQEQRQAFKELVLFGQKVREKAIGEIGWTDEARAFFDDWYVNKLVIPPNSTLAGYYGSKQSLVMKVAMLVAISETDFIAPVLITTECIETALDFLAQIEVNLSRVFQGMGRNELSQVSTRVYDLIEAYPKRVIPEKELRAASFRDCGGNEFSEVIRHLQNAGLIDVARDEKTGVLYVGLKGSIPVSISAKPVAPTAGSSQQPATVRPTAPPTAISGDLDLNRLIQ